MMIIAGMTASFFILRAGKNIDIPEHTTEINRHLLYLSENWEALSGHSDIREESDKSYDYTVLDMEGNILISTRSDMAGSIASATSNYDIIRDIESDGKIVGRLIVDNNMIEQQKKNSERTVIAVVILVIMLIIIFAGYYIYLYRRIVRPFDKLNGFAERIAAGDMETPLNMDREHIFGGFTEAFDIMREELKNSREREETALRSRKELIAELSHDIKTPVASIKAMAEVMSLTAKSDHERETIAAISSKADQIDRLISNLFHATLEELEQLEVHIEEVSSADILAMIHEADHMKKVTDPYINDSIVLGDRMRINQVISNIIYNSYKYADTEIFIRSRIETSDAASTEKKDHLVIEISDKGGGVPEDEIDIITGKFRRGSNSKDKDGSGLGLYISKYLMEKMGGGLTCHNGEEGLVVTLRLKLA